MLNWQILLDERIPKHHEDLIATNVFRAQADPMRWCLRWERLMSSHHNHLSCLHTHWLEVAVVSVNNGLRVDLSDWLDWLWDIFGHELNILKTYVFQCYYHSIVHHMQPSRLSINSNVMVSRLPKPARHPLATNFSDCSHPFLRMCKSNFVMKFIFEKWCQYHHMLIVTVWPLFSYSVQIYRA